MKYYKVSSEQQADELSRNTYKLMYPDNVNVSTTHLFGWRTNDLGDVIIEVPEDTFPVFKKKDFNTVLADIESIPDITITNEAKAELNTGEIDPSSLLNGLEEVDYQYLLDNGFIKQSKSPIE